MSKRVTIWVSVVVLSAVVFLVTPFVLLPFMLSSKPVTANEFTAGDVFNFVYTPFLNSLSKENPYMRVWMKYSLYQCSRYEGACVNVSE